ncbi:lipid-A-disaccharide synthase [Prevotella veroralis]|uniref:Lipid-A-disaccharide synthase n=1 Tax=Prevotella veroralis F0319 TaxID=649761 RepID=C9MMB0_9BACT|nr:lipid-A-disaccharide synthase [Prevotella veroralis]EEX19295.1 lipid-A-disaccharide synthase [Prevotella veroralis F0319]QUB40958.1 lipid-A-disaccharide synthase [Prevotella veroralis]
MKYYLIVGEASGDLHASRLMQSLMQYDPAAEFRFLGGDLMQRVGGTRVKHYRELAYMGFVPVLLHLPTIFKNMKMCKEDIVHWQPDVVILIDYPGFNLSIAKYVKKNTNIPVFYYISPKIWAWKEWRIKAIKRDVKEMFSILPFEIAFYEKKHHYKIHYVGNPTKEEVDNFQHVYTESKDEFCQRNNLSSKPIIAILAGSRKQEIKDNLPSMLEAARHFEDYQMVIAAAPSIEKSYYKKYLGDSEAKMVELQTYELLTHSTAALVTSGTATLETALLNVPQVVCYETPVPKLIRFAFKHIIKVRFISLVNLIADKEIVQELLADRFSIYNIANELYRILPGQPARERMLADYQIVRERLGDAVAPDNAAKIMVEKLTSSIAQANISQQSSNEFQV